MRYFAAAKWRQRFATAPSILWVCSDNRAEERVVRAVEAAGLTVPIFITAEWRYERPERGGRGVFGDIWRHQFDSARLPLITATGGKNGAPDA